MKMYAFNLLVATRWQLHTSQTSYLVLHMRTSSKSDVVTMVTLITAILPLFLYCILYLSKPYRHDLGKCIFFLL